MNFLYRYKTAFLSIAAAAVIFTAGAAASYRTAAYMINASQAYQNTFTVLVGSASSKIIEVFDPYKVTIEENNCGKYVSQFTKSIQVINDGYVESFVRVKAIFTDSEIEDLTELSLDGTTWYSVSEYYADLYSITGGDWDYDSDDGYCYYTKALRSIYDAVDGEGNTYSDISDYEEDSGITTDSTSGQYYSDEILSASDQVTSPLFSYVRVTFPSLSSIKSFSILIYDESCPAYLTDSDDVTDTNAYVTAWKNYLAG